MVMLFVFLIPHSVRHTEAILDSSRIGATRLTITQDFFQNWYLSS